ncbi:MAG: PAS domain S-box protein [Deltaproteobacteria bacterium]|nr:PAS domain S-box protein [Deltaproteobacteria bacterium]
MAEGKQGPVENAQERHYRERLSLIHTIEQSILSAETPQAIAQAVLPQLRQVLPCQRATLFLFDFATKEAVILATEAAQQSPLAEGARIPFESSLQYAEAVFKGDIRLVEDVLTIANPSPQMRARQAEGLRAFLGVPLSTQGTVIGMLNVWSTQPGAFTSEDIDTAHEVATSLAVVIQQARLHEAMRQNQVFLDSLIAHIPDMVFVKDAKDLRFVRFNKAGERLLGYRQEELLGKNDYDFFPPDEADFFISKDREVLKSPEPLEIPEETILTKDKRLLTLRTKKIALRDANGTPQYLLGISEDITDRRAAERALAESEERYRKLVELSPDAMLVHSEGRVVYINDVGVRLVGAVSKADVLGTAILDWIAPESLAAVTDNIQRIYAKQISTRTERKIRRVDGITVDVESGSVLVEYQGKPAIQVILRDITQRKEVERLKNELISTVSHELRTPLTSLRGFTELLLQRDFPRPQQQHLLTVMLNESMRLTNLVNNFLDLQRLQSPATSLRKEKIDVAGFLHERFVLVAQDGSSHSWQFDVPWTMPSLWGDRERLQQAIANLLANAAKYSPQGGAITLGAREANHEIVIWVADQGIGIPPEAIPQLFGKFFRVDNSATRGIGGTGLGLALVKEIVEAHQGRVWVDSVLGQGSTFFVALPLGEALSA